MSDLKAAFDKAMADSKNLSERPDNATLLKIYALYKQWSEARREGPLNQRAFGVRIKERGIAEYRGGAGTRYWMGLIAKPLPL